MLNMRITLGTNGWQISIDSKVMILPNCEDVAAGSAGKLTAAKIKRACQRFIPKREVM